MTEIVARGIFQWDGAERRTDRYGTFVIVAHDEDTAFDRDGVKHVFSDWEADEKDAFLDTAKVARYVGKRTRITARVINTRQSRHIGDLFRGIKPSMPDIGEEIDLGAGEFFTEPSTWPAGGCCGEIFIGLRPDDGRADDWFDPRKLYRLHTQTVEIALEVIGGGE